MIVSLKRLTISSKLVSFYEPLRRLPDELLLLNHWHRTTCGAPIDSTHTTEWAEKEYFWEVYSSKEENEVFMTPALISSTTSIYPTTFAAWEMQHTSDFE